jgi:fumarate reductase flavoprotein subunit
VRDSLAEQQSRLDVLLNGRGTESATVLKAEMQSLMTEKVGIFRTAEDLRQAVDGLQELLERSRRIGVPYKVKGANPELVVAYRVQKMLKLALCVSYGALQRTESRGAHFRNDYPHRNDAEWLKRTLATWPRENDSLPTLGYEPLDVGRMELAPGWRGYGAKDYIDHPDTPARIAEIEGIRAAAGADRFRCQSQLMPFEHLLPERLRGRNERIDEPLSPGRLPKAERSIDEPAPPAKPAEVEPQ